MNTKNKKAILNGLIFIFFIFLTFYIIFKDNSISDIVEVVKTADIKFVLLAVFCMCWFVMSEGINIARTLKLLDCDINFLSGIKYALVGFFFSSVTPSASGGDPMQIYCMKKDGLQIGKSALAILTEFSSFQFVTILMSIIGFILNYKFIESSVGNVKYFLMLGVLVNTAILGIILLSIFSKKLIIKLVDFTCNLFWKFKIKNIETFRAKCIEQIDNYKKGAKLLFQNKKVLLKIVLTTTLQITLYHSIPYLIYLSFGLNEASYFQFLTLQAVLYISVSYMPLPRSSWFKRRRFFTYLQIIISKCNVKQCDAFKQGNKLLSICHY